MSYYYFEMTNGIFLHVSSWGFEFCFINSHLHWDFCDNIFCTGSIAIFQIIF